MLNYVQNLCTAAPSTNSNIYLTETIFEDQRSWPHAGLAEVYNPGPCWVWYQRIPGRGRQQDCGGALPGWRQTAAVASQDSRWTPSTYGGEGQQWRLLALGGRLEEDWRLDRVCAFFSFSYGLGEEWAMMCCSSLDAVHHRVSRQTLLTRASTTGC